MKSVNRHFLVATAAIGLAAYSCASVGAERQSMSVPNNLEDEVAQLELSWAPGVGSKEYEYYVRVGKLADRLANEDHVAANAAAVKLLGSLLAKRSEPIAAREADLEVGAVDLLAMAKLARFLLANDMVSTVERREKVQILSKLLGHVRAEVVPDYVPKRVFANVGPPAGVPLGMAGMDPAVIADPVARATYKAKIRDNEMGNLANKRQRQLGDMTREFARPTVEYMSRVASTDKGAQSIISQAIIDARLTDCEKDEVLQAFPAGPRH